MKSSHEHDTSTQRPAISIGYNSPFCADIAWGKQVEFAHVVLGLCEMWQARSLIILRNVRTHWTQLGLTVQGLINSKPGFLSCFICNSCSLLFFGLFKNSFCSFVQAGNAVCNQLVQQILTHLAPDGSASELLWVFKGVPVQSLIFKGRGGFNICRAPRESTPAPRFWVLSFFFFFSSPRSQ